MASETADKILAVQGQTAQTQDGKDLHFELKPPPGLFDLKPPPGQWRVASLQYPYYNSPFDYSELDFCPNLVVPKEAADYKLYVPVPILLDGNGPHDVMDSAGERVVRIAPRGPSVCHSSQARNAITPSTKSHREHSRAINWWRLMLLEPSDTTRVMAQCCAIGANEFHIRRVDGTFFAKLVHDKESGCRYTLAVFDGRLYNFLGDRSEQFYQMEDDSGALLATAARCRSDGGFFTLRVAPSTEVGLVLCGILCVEWHVASLYRDRIVL